MRPDLAREIWGLGTRSGLGERERDLKGSGVQMLGKHGTGEMEIGRAGALHA